jgi:hypothetical protein
MIGAIIGKAHLKQTLHKTHYYLGNISEIEDQVLDVIERNDSGDCMCIIHDKGLVDVHHTDIAQYHEIAIVSSIINEILPKEFELDPKETVCDDDYNVYFDYVYIADNKLIRSNIQGTVRDLKRDLGAKEIRRCEVIKRQTEGARIGDIIK